MFRFLDISISPTSASKSDSSKETLNSGTDVSSNKEAKQQVAVSETKLPVAEPIEESVPHETMETDLENKDANETEGKKKKKDDDKNEKKEDEESRKTKDEEKEDKKKKDEKEDVRKKAEETDDKKNEKKVCVFLINFVVLQSLLLTHVKKSGYIKTKCRLI